MDCINMDHIQSRFEKIVQLPSLYLMEVACRFVLQSMSLCHIITRDHDILKPHLFLYPQMIVLGFKARVLMEGRSLCLQNLP